MQGAAFEKRRILKESWRAQWKIELQLGASKGLLTDVRMGIREVNKGCPRKPLSSVIAERTQCNKTPLKVRAAREGTPGQEL